MSGRKAAERQPLHFMTSPKTYVYVDAFNLYYGCVKGTPNKWLNIRCLCEIMLPQNQIVKIKYFTARVNARPSDPQAPIRQQVYLRALETLPNLSIVYGHFLSHVVTMPVANPVPNQPKYVEVIKTEEKGSDVNLATHLLNDAYQSKYDIAVVVSNDSDLLAPIQIVKGPLGKTIGILNPQKRPSRELLKEASFFKTIRPNTLAKAQFPKILRDAHGEIHKPSGW